MKKARVKRVQQEAELKKKANKRKPTLKVGDRVRMEAGKAVGSIDMIEKRKALINYGLFTTNVSLDQLELVQPAKKSNPEASGQFLRSK